MHGKADCQTAIFGNWSPASTALSIMLMVLLLILMFLFLTFTAQPAQGQTFQVIYNFTCGVDGGLPYAGVTIDQSGKLYGTTSYFGAPPGDGTVFKLESTSAGWFVSTLYDFQGGDDGALPYARVIFGPDSNLYGTTGTGGGGCPGYGGCGTVFRLNPPATACTGASCSWKETVLYRFTGGSDGNLPYSEVAFDQVGNLYGTTNSGGMGHNGTVYELTRSGSDWLESILHSFSGGGGEGASPAAGVTLDQNGNLYGTTTEGGAYGDGTVFQLVPSGSGWAENILYSFHGGRDGAVPFGGVILDGLGNVYGTTAGLGREGGMIGPGAGGSVFILSPSHGGWEFSVLHSFPQPPIGNGVDGPWADLFMDSTGKLYGTTFQDALGFGSVFKMRQSNSGWTYAELHDFGGPDGSAIRSNVVLDTNGNLYGTSYNGGAYGCGVVWEITP